MIDQCGNCMLRGNIKECKAAPCNHHESWYAVEQQKQIDELVAENKRLKKDNSTMIYRAIAECRNAMYEGGDPWFCRVIDLEKWAIKENKNDT